MQNGGPELSIKIPPMVAPIAPQTWPEVRPLLRSIVRSATYGSFRKSGEATAWRLHVSSFAHELVALDLPTARAIVTVQNTKQWDVTWRDAFDAGRLNIANMHPADTNVPGTDGAFVDADQSTYISSAILTPGWLASFARPDGPRPIAFVPTEDTLVIGTDDPDEGPKYFEMAEQMYCESDRPVSPEAFTVRDGRLVPFDKAGPHPLRPLALRARTCAAMRQYGEQTEFLTQKYRDELVDVFVAKPMTFDTGHGVRAGAVWGEGLTYDLPEVDYICFVNDDVQFTVPFSVVADVVGLVHTPSVFPRRYRVSGWPEPALMDALRFHALPKAPE